jgi:hypothetical protein
LVAEIGPGGCVNSPGVWPTTKESTVSDVTWLPAPKCPNYEISSDGRIRSIDRTVKYKNGGERKFPSRERKTFLVKGYPHLTIRVDGKKRNFYVHLLVCEAFHGPRPSPMHEARHLNGDPTDNRAENLSWGTKSENAQDGIRHGRNKELNKTHCKWGHPFDGQNTATTSKGTRACRACRRIKNREYYEKNRVAVSQRTRARLERRAAEEGRKLRKRSSLALTTEPIAEVESPRERNRILRGVA